MAVAVAGDGAGIETVLNVVLEIAESRVGRARPLRWVVNHRVGYRRLRGVQDETGVRG